MGYKFYRYWQPVTSGAKLVGLNGQQILYAKHTGTLTDLYGAEASGDDFTIHPNTTDTYPKIEMYGGASFKMYHAAGYALEHVDGATIYFQTYYSSNKSYVRGTNTSGDDLVLKANTTDSDNITIEGNGDIVFTPTGDIKFGTHGAIGGMSVTGYIPIKDIGGTTRNLAVVS